MKNLKGMPTLILLISMSFVAFFIFYINFLHTPVSAVKTCKAQMSLLHGEFTLNSRYQFNFLDTKGDVIINGQVVNQGITYVINREITFEYQKKTDHLLLKNTRIEFFSGDEDNKSGINYHLPDFFTKKGGELAIDINQGIYGNPVFVVSGTPLFFCEKAPDVF